LLLDEEEQRQLVIDELKEGLLKLVSLNNNSGIVFKYNFKENLLYSIIDI
jgi:hypothetical protein